MHRTTAVVDGAYTIAKIEEIKYIPLSDLYKLITLFGQNASQWFQRRESAFDEGEYVISDEHFPGKQGRLWIRLPDGALKVLREVQASKRLTKVIAPDKVVNDLLRREGLLKEETEIEEVQEQTLDIELDFEEDKTDVKIEPPPPKSLLNGGGGKSEPGSSASDEGKASSVDIPVDVPVETPRGELVTYIRLLFDRALSSFHQTSVPIERVLTSLMDDADVSKTGKAIILHSMEESINNLIIATREDFILSITTFLDKRNISLCFKVES